MKFFGPGQTLFLFITGVLLLVSGALGGLLLQTYREYASFKARELAYQERLEGLEMEVDAYEAYLERLLNDPDFLEHVARERLGYSKEGELIFRFEPTSKD